MTDSEPQPSLPTDLVSRLPTVAKDYADYLTVDASNEVLIFRFLLKKYVLTSYAYLLSIHL